MGAGAWSFRYINYEPSFPAFAIDTVVDKVSTFFGLTNVPPGLLSGLF